MIIELHAGFFADFLPVSMLGSPELGAQSLKGKLL